MQIGWGHLQRTCVCAADSHENAVLLMDAATVSGTTQEDATLSA